MKISCTIVVFQSLLCSTRKSTSGSTIFNIIEKLLLFNSKNVRFPCALNWTETFKIGHKFLIWCKQGSRHGKFDHPPVVSADARSTRTLGLLILMRALPGILLGATLIFSYWQSVRRLFGSCAYLNIYGNCGTNRTKSGKWSYIVFSSKPAHY